jgi:hypothetical protein
MHENIFGPKCGQKFELRPEFRGRRRSWWSPAPAGGRCSAGPGFRRPKGDPPRFTDRQSLFYSTTRGKSSSIPRVVDLRSLTGRPICCLTAATLARKSGHRRRGAARVTGGLPLRWAAVGLELFSSVETFFRDQKSPACNAQKCPLWQPMGFFTLGASGAAAASAYLAAHRRSQKQ